MLCLLTNNVGIPQVFLSYCWANKARVMALRHVLEEQGLVCWMDEAVMSGGQQLFEEIDTGISQAGV